MSTLSFIKGWLGEAQGSFAHWAFLDTSTYVSINNITLPTANGSTQIDHVIVSRFGIFVIETKNMKGWIFGSEREAHWTQSLFGKKYRFQNPLRQNYLHTQTIANFLDVDHSKMFSVVMFWGECEFKTTMPPNVLRNGYITYIKSKNQIQFSDSEVFALVTSLKSGMLATTRATSTAHVNNLNDRFASSTICPKCGGTLVQRIAKSGKNTGNNFTGCSNFPRCRYIAAP